MKKISLELDEQLISKQKIIKKVPLLGYSTTRMDGIHGIEPESEAKHQIEAVEFLCDKFIQV